MKKMLNDSIDKHTPAELGQEHNVKRKRSVRGKYYQAYRKGHMVRIHREDGTVNVQHFTPEEGAVMLDPDVREYFPTSKSVNRALRSLVTLIPKSRRRG